MNLRTAWMWVTLAVVSGCYLARPAPAEDRSRAGAAPFVPRSSSLDASVDATSLPDAGKPPRAGGDHPMDRGNLPDAGALPPRSPDLAPEPHLRVAFLGDQGLGTAAREVLQLIKRERAALVVHAGDLSYGLAPPSAWETMINDELGADFPYVVAAGNHDLDDWYGPAGFAALLNARLTRTPQVRCEGEVGLSSVCRFRGLELLISGVGTIGIDHEGFLERSLSRPGPTFRVCVWHKNQHDLQVGTKLDEVGWAAYEICARHGAAIVTGHEHSYSRTLTLTAVGDRSRNFGPVGDPSRVELGRNRTFVVVSGLGGHSTRERSADHEDDRWWASIYANNFQMQNGKVTGSKPQVAFGALFIDYHIDGDPRRARAYFKTTRDEVVDRFEIEAATPRSLQQR